MPHTRTTSYTIRHSCYGQAQILDTTLAEAAYMGKNELGSCGIVSVDGNHSTLSPGGTGALKAGAATAVEPA